MPRGGGSGQLSETAPKQTYDGISPARHVREGSSFSLISQRQWNLTPKDGMHYFGIRNMGLIGHNEPRWTLNYGMEKAWRIGTCYICLADYLVYLHSDMLALKFGSAQLTTDEIKLSPSHGYYVPKEPHVKYIKIMKFTSLIIRFFLSILHHSALLMCRLTLWLDIMGHKVCAILYLWQAVL